MRGTHNPIDGDNFTEDDTLWVRQPPPPLPIYGTHLIKFLVVIRGVLTPPPRIEAPVTKIPLD